MSLQEEPRTEGTFSFFVGTKKENVPSVEEPRAQTGLRSGKLAAHLARNTGGMSDYRFFRINIRGLRAYACG